MLWKFYEFPYADKLQMRFEYFAILRANLFSGGNLRMSEVDRRRSMEQNYTGFLMMMMQRELLVGVYGDRRALTNKTTTSM